MKRVSQRLAYLLAVTLLVTAARFTPIHAIQQSNSASSGNSQDGFSQPVKGVSDAARSSAVQNFRQTAQREKLTGVRRTIQKHVERPEPIPFDLPVPKGAVIKGRNLLNEKGRGVIDPLVPIEPC